VAVDATPLEEFCEHLLEPLMQRLTSDDEAAEEHADIVRAIVERWQQ
jgi:hypothetical protein